MKQYISQNRISKFFTWVCKQIATLGPVGYLPAPGTMGTICALPLLVGLRTLEQHVSWLDEGVILAMLIGISVWIVNKALSRADFFESYDADPSEIIVDEVVGFFVVMLYMPLKPVVVLIGFFYFRFFDIMKPLGIDQLQALPGGWGIVIDDIAAALCARICMQFTLLFLRI